MIPRGHYVDLTRPYTDITLTLRDLTFCSINNRGETQDVVELRQFYQSKLSSMGVPIPTTLRVWTSIFEGLDKQKTTILPL